MNIEVTIVSSLAVSVLTQGAALPREMKTAYLFITSSVLLFFLSFHVWVCALVGTGRGLWLASGIVFHLIHQSVASQTNLELANVTSLTLQLALVIPAMPSEAEGTMPTQHFMWILEI